VCSSDLPTHRVADQPEMIARTVAAITGTTGRPPRGWLGPGLTETLDTPDQIVLNPATEYVAKFTEEIEKSKVVHARVLAQPLSGDAPEGEPVAANATIHSLSRMLVNDSRLLLPIADESGALIGTLNRQAALDLLLGDA